MVLMGTWLRNEANDRSSALAAASTLEHYTAEIARLERRWGREAFNLKTRLEAQGILEMEHQRHDRLLAYLISQGSSVEFPSLRIENFKGEVIASYDYAGRDTPKASFLPGEISRWVIDSANGHLYLVFRQFIWLGEENGVLLLFKPMDHALLTHLMVPGTRLSLWSNGKPVASSEGDPGLEETTTRFAKPESGPLNFVLTWPGPVSDLTPQLLVELRQGNILGMDTVWIAAAFAFLAILLGALLGLARFLVGCSRQLDAVVQAANRLASQDNGPGSETIENHLKAQQTGPVEALSELAATLENQIRKLP
jgi:hypothetical protein